jgi:hypothetical protein
MERLAARSGAMESRQGGMATADAVQPGLGLGLALDAAGPVADSGSRELPPAAPRVRRVDRRQMQFRVGDIERLVDSDDAVRAIWEVTGSLDLSAFYEPIAARQGTAGRTPWDPRLLVAIWIYASALTLRRRTGVRNLALRTSKARRLAADSPPASQGRSPTGTEPPPPAPSPKTGSRHPRFLHSF